MILTQDFRNENTGSILELLMMLFRRDCQIQVVLSRQCFAQNVPQKNRDYLACYGSVFAHQHDLDTTTVLWDNVLA